MKSLHKSLMLASSLAMLLALGACDRYSGSAPSRESAAAAKEKSQDAAARARANKPGDDARAMGAAAAGKVDDAAITSSVSAALAAEKDLAAFKIEVDTKDGVVTLTGPARSATAREHATEVAKSVKGVSSVDNKMTVKPG